MPENSTPYRLRVVLGEAQFEAEGDKDAVMEQYRLFLEAQRTAPRSEPVSADAERTSISTSQPALVSPETGASIDSELPQDLLDRVYSREKGVISLRVLPQSKMRDPDVLLLLLFGYLKLRGDHDVYGTQLMKAAQVSGISIDRVDRVISQHRGLFIRGGARRGTRYALNNQGEQRARSILETMFD